MIFEGCWYEIERKQCHTISVVHSDLGPSDTRLKVLGGERLELLFSKSDLRVHWTFKYELLHTLLFPHVDNELDLTRFFVVRVSL